MKPYVIAIGAALTGLLNLASAAADAAELKVWTARAISTVLAEVGPEFEPDIGSVDAFKQPASAQTRKCRTRRGN